MMAVSQARFDAFSGYARRPEARLYAQELAWLESESGDVFATLVVDVAGEFSGVIFARDLAERFRWVAQTDHYSDPESAMRAIEPLALDIESDLEEARIQGDETSPVDFFAPVSPHGRLHENFKRLAFGEHNVAARSMISLLMRWYGSQDGNFVEQFQTTGFDARIWELYLFATLVEAGFDVTQPTPSPDFLVRGPAGHFYIEATTINPSQAAGVPEPSVRPDVTDDWSEYLEGYLPIRFAGPLTAKLKKEYWKHPDVANSALVFAIQDFHDQLSMLYSAASLPRYLFGFAVDETLTTEGLVAVQRPVSVHTWGNKEVPSNFFQLPGSEHVSAVVFNGSATIAKFDRMGAKSGLGAKDVTLVHCGRRIRDGGTGKPERFSAVVGENYSESWIDGMNVYHNPHAIHPLDEGLLPDAAHHRLLDGEVYSSFPPDHLFSSQVLVIRTTG